MLIQTRDKTRISFGKLSDDGVLNQSPLANPRQDLSLFTTSNFQHMVNNIADMFGYGHGAIQVNVDTNDLQAFWKDKNGNNRVEEDEITLRLTMNASINTYRRVSTYGQHFMYQAAVQYGYPVTFGIAAHEVGHLVTHHALNELETRIVDGKPALIVTKFVQDYWDELCADYLAGIVLGKARPILSQEPLKRYLSGTVGGKEHPDGFWRTFAVEMGYQWGRNNPAAVTDRVLSNTTGQKQLLQSFYQSYYQGIYSRVDARQRRGKTQLPNYLMEPCNGFVGFL